MTWNAEADEQAVDLGYIPRALQYKLHREMRRFNVVVCHRRFGKTIFSINHMIAAAVRSKLPAPRYAYLAPTYGQAKRIVWDPLKHYTKNIPGVLVNEADMRVDIPANGARIMLLSAETPDSLKGIYLDGSILDEYASMNPATWSEVIRPTLSDRRGWANFIGTPKGQNNFYELYEYATRKNDPEWFAALYKASQTGIISAEELASNRRTMTEDEYEQEFECSFVAALSGAYFGKELGKAAAEGRIGRVPYDPAIPVDTYWDLGINDTTSIWFVQSVRGVHRFIDHYEICGASLPEIVADVQKKKYVLGQFVLPHDAAARDLSTGRTQVQVFYSLGCRNVRVIPRVGSKRESINAARMIFGKCEFAATKCELGLKALAQYQRKWNAKSNVYEDAPLHNWASNSADAFQQFGLGCRDDSRADAKTERGDFGSNRPFQAITDYDVYGHTS